MSAGAKTTPIWATSTFKQGSVEEVHDSIGVALANLVIEAENEKVEPIWSTLSIGFDQSWTEDQRLATAEVRVYPTRISLVASVLGLVAE